MRTNTDHAVPDQSAQELPEHCQEALHAVRGAILQVCHGRGVNPSRPRELSEQLGIERNLAWKLSRIVNATRLADAVAHLPGPPGQRILLETLGQAGVNAPAMAQLSKAFDDFDRMIKIHTGDRATLELALANLGSGTNRLEASRKKAFQGNAGIWGVQARVRTTTHFLAPNPDDPRRLDTGLVGGLVDVLRLRPNLRWPLFRTRMYHDDGSRIPVDSTPIDPGETTPGPLLVREFCTGCVPEIHVRQDSRGVLHELGEGPIGKRGMFSCFYGEIKHAALPRYQSEEDRVGDLYSTITMPTEHLLFDVMLHKDLAKSFEPEVLIYGRPAGGLDEHVGAGEHDLLPTDTGLMSIGSCPPICATALAGGYDKVVERVFERAGWSARDFVGYRLTIRYPVLPSTAVIRFALQERPGL